ncbi:MAG: DEAD/DEAH box helicase [Deltaproteobacteria bacterium]|nr:DEAD/DEAH box helicase [Deltaproteobacteria bacterium]
MVARPADAGVLGRYATGRRGAHDRPYETLLLAIDPPAGSCDCPDFLRSSLGLCKHLLVVLDDVYQSPRRLRAASRGGPAPSASALSWDPVRPLTGAGDPLERLRLVDPGAARDARAGAQQWFRPGATGALVLAAVPRERVAERLAQVRVLRALLPRGRATRGSAAVEPAVRRLLEDEADRLERVLALRSSRRALDRARRTLRGTLYPYQAEGVERFLGEGRLLLADDMGLGKTVQAIAACHSLYATRQVARGLIIVPASLKPQWQREWDIFTDSPVTVVDGGPAERRAAYRRQGRGFLIANYEQVLRDLELMHAWRPDLVILDEAQRIKNWATKTAAYVKRLRPRYRLVLTGTPMENRLDELASLFDWVDDEALEPKWRLQPWHSEFADGRREIVGARNLDTLRERLAPSMLRRLRRDVLAQLPPRTDTAVPVELTPEQAEEHAALDQPIARLMAIARQRPLTQEQFLRLMSLLTTQRIVSNGLAQLRFAEVWPSIASRAPTEALVGTLAAPKLRELREILAQVAAAQGRKVVVFSQWRRMLTLAHWAVGDLLAGAGLRAAFFTGHEGQRRRTQNLVEFHDDPAVAVLFATDAGGVGLNLQRAASCCVNLELPWNPAVLEQRIGRIYRHGQTAPVDVYNLVTQDSIEARIAGLVADKRALFAGLFDGESDVVRFDRSASFLARLERLVTPVVPPELPADAVLEQETPEIAAAAEQETDAAIAAAEEGEDVMMAEAGLAAAAAAPPRAQADGAAAVETTAAPVPTTDAVPADAVRRLFGQLQVRTRDDGGVTIDAPPDSALALAAIFEGMAGMLRAGARAPVAAGP